MNTMTQFELGNSTEEVNFKYIFEKEVKAEKEVTFYFCIETIIKGG
jgi:hypothetical protein